MDNPEATCQEDAFDFDLVETGCYGSVTAISKDKNSIKLNHAWSKKTLPVGLPPVLPDWRADVEHYLTCPEKLPIHDTAKSQKFWPRESCPDNLYSIDLCPLQTTIQVERNPTTGQLLGYKEEYLTDTGSTSKTSLSLKRAPGPPSQDVRGNTLNIPFWPGGLDEPDLEKTTIENVDLNSEMNLESDLLNVAPGMKSGVTFDLHQSNKSSAVKSSTDQNTPQSVINLADILAQDIDDLDLGEAEGAEEPEEPEEKLETVVIRKSESLENLVQATDRGPDTDTVKVKVKPVVKEEWAVSVDIDAPVEDFYKRIPDMAYKWPFELDVFQKQAILHLEDHDSVFVAAHTSAGKTVVAEYAIALSLKHMTRTIYTSPIKALSNQKYRDFKQTFKDVGLITGDVQMNQTASCLIMTTEILRSMLYNGSDVIRDLEWVIFDEVHYINDADRGVVWEEVLIMLPKHVNIILLSATVPNTIEFADWIGRTKRKKIYVISTLKRPVPLEHFLYTGNSGKTSDQLFLLVDHKKTFLTNGYSKALAAKKERASKSSQNFGAKGTRGAHPNQDKNIWTSVIDMLKKKDKLPVVAFTFSKKKIEDNVNNLHSLDLTTQKEKSEIHIFFHKSITRLKDPDKKLPQVMQMEDHLKRGLGMHHSGILPILKEVVEMLFQRGLVKILFATETFAMGVNMPARTVVFDSIRKHDGTSFRDLLPGEYIQMAGRAGRRGLDTTGTVIILCKGDVQEMSDLHKMMLGKPTKLESQFRLTYSMILNLLRVEQLRVEDMIKRSFSEFHSQKDTIKHKNALEELHSKVANITNIECFLCSVDLEKYYQSCKEYHKSKKELQTIVLSHPTAIKLLGAGRVVVVDNASHSNVLGIVLQTSSSSSDRTFTCLVICDDKHKEGQGETKSDGNIGLQVTPVLSNTLYRPEGVCCHQLVVLKAEDIGMITTKTIRVEADRIVNDVRKRQQPRFRDDPPNQAVSIATQELLRLTEGNPQGLPGLDPVKDLHLRDIDMVEQFRAFTFLEGSLKTFQCVNCPRFQEHFGQLSSNMKLKDEYIHLKFLLSDESLQLLPEYQQRIEVLRALNYIDANNTVQLKGRVACEISSHELMITELVFENALTELHPTEIAALLSSVVFEQKRASEPNIIDTLEKGKERILEIADGITALQKQMGMLLGAEYKETFKFGLMEVVFEWARGMPFAEITNLTDVQEGIIVRCIQRLHETLRDVRNAARIIGDPVLYQKMDEASFMIKRDIVFAASLYTQ
ncbi:helicase SKI2W-like [Mizuhopecten yessoensis]|uniref:Helicase SKI2W n=1 Tax=Mizuhopecten yessoensis TaxID=6573 RepID=A0A210PTZ7_MIZYE|nr:helicase SKI2W-like [Mizuhopecten yessoensis]XP_021375275.1 helicase SKI2W-like [Mizuhopecten yessoensis]OWF39926.1 Helicase SKI2W [Mizuhopecten yessoensis]